MDFTQAALLAFFVLGIVEGFKKAFPTQAANVRYIYLAALLAGQGVTQAVAHSAWGHEQVVGNRPLDLVNTWSLVLVGLGLAFFAVGIHKVLGAVGNIGQNKADAPAPPAA